MKIFFNQPYLPLKQIQSSKQPSFDGRGKPIDLRYIYQKHQAILPQRVFNEVNKILSENPKELPSLMQIHKYLYAPLLECKTLEEAKALFPEFSGINDIKINYQKRTFKDEKPKLDVNKDFALTILQEYWAKLRKQDEITADFGFGTRSVIKWAMQKKNIPGMSSQYKTILNSSDEEGNKIIASKTAAWNALHPDLMLAKNKHAAQGQKRPEVRERQSKIIKEYDIEHPERREKISRYGKLVWEKCPEVAAAMSEFAKKESGFTKLVIKKDIKGKRLTEYEKRAKKGFYSRFWKAYPELKPIYKAARIAAAKDIKD